MKIFLAGIVANLIVWGLLEQYPPETHPNFDLLLFLEVSIACALGCVVMILGYWHQRWTSRALGLFGFLVGNALVWGISGLANHLWYRPWMEHVANFARASLFVAVPLLLIGLIGWLRGWWGSVIEPAAPPAPLDPNHEETATP
jgi:uncharacterized membrane protein YagU involved in acid resistance